MMRPSLQTNSQPAASGPVTREVHQALVQYLSRRSDLGFDTMLLKWALEPASPFDPKGRGNFRKGFVLVVLVALGLAATFVYFNFLAGGQ